MVEFCPKCHPILPGQKLDRTKVYGCKCEQEKEGLTYRIKLRHWDGGMGAMICYGAINGVDGITYSDKELAQKNADKLNAEVEEKYEKGLVSEYNYPEYYIVDNTHRNFWD